MARLVDASHFGFWSDSGDVATTTASVTVPPGAHNALKVINLFLNGSSGVNPTTPTGWTSTGYYDNGSFGVYTFYKFVNVQSDDDGGTFTVNVTLNQSVKWSAQASVWTGVSRGSALGTPFYHIRVGTDGVDVLNFSGFKTIAGGYFNAVAAIPSDAYSFGTATNATTNFGTPTSLPRQNWNSDSDIAGAAYFTNSYNITTSGTASIGSETGTTGLTVKGVAYVFRPGEVLTPTENLGLTDSVVISVARSISATDNLGLTDIADRPLNKIFVDTFGLTDSVRISGQLNIADNMGLSDSATRNRATSNEPLGVTDSVALTMSNVKTDNLGLTDSTTRGLGFTRTTGPDTMGLSDSVVGVKVGVRLIEFFSMFQIRDVPTTIQMAVVQRGSTPQGFDWVNAVVQQVGRRVVVEEQISAARGEYDVWFRVDSAEQLMCRYTVV